ncbi:hypothetical protein GS429_21435 [Natronorubrum sp. JWXQ-INN-674]|uniref:Uncharacterized protein n=1 Tax=Natronorubrum halalkaliphilum TaxID=2691917 RepID=A0A6B0VVJ4_9EURY|nr:hypothetical protein [Natronorubrum halalkaliphilum]MXV64589.1 hypothetical protein [Natronorubrum halalkaliphilum]
MGEIKRRSILKSSGVALTGGALVSSVSARGNAQKTRSQSYDIESGIFVAATDVEELSSDDIEQARQRAVDEYVSRDDPGVMSTAGSEYLVLSTAEQSLASDSSIGSPLVGYALQFEDGYPRERKYRVPADASAEIRQNRIREAVKELERNIVTADSSDVVDPDPGWGDPLFFSVDEEEVMSGDEDEGIVFPFDYYGKFNSEVALYEGRETEENQEYGCTIGCTQVPGNDMDNTNYNGDNYETLCRISPYGPSDLPILTDWGPDEDNTGGILGNVDLESISFGADSSGPYGEVTISPSSTDVYAQYDETNFADDGPVETVYEIAGADDKVMQQFGNSAVFVTDTDSNAICDTTLDCAFSAPNSDSHPNSEHLSENIRRWDLDGE